MSIGMSTITPDSFHGKRCQQMTDELDDDVPCAPPLFGREHENSLLSDAYQRVLNDHGYEIVVVHSQSGSGKSSLVNSLRGPVCASLGYFCAGKYFQNTGVQEPFSAIMEVFSDLCDFAIQSEDFDEERRLKIQERLGSDGQLLAKSITSLSLFLDPSYSEKYLSSTRGDTEFRKFKNACRSFLHAMSSYDHPIVLFLDDIQWMDDGSRQLVTMFQQENLTNVMLILVYREEEAMTVTDWLLRKDQLDCTKVQLTDILLKDLSVAAINELVAEALKVEDPQNTFDLSQLISSKTRGNAFHVIQFIEALNRENLLVFNEETSTWEYDVVVIQHEMMVDDSVAELLARKIQCLSPKVLHTLQVASLLGYSFEQEILVKVCASINAAGFWEEMDDGHPTVDGANMKEALEMGFVEKTADGHQFVHDKLQSSFSSMFDSGDLEHLRVIIGETYLAIGGIHDNYHAAVHLNQSSAYKMDKELRHKMAKINLDASRFCCERSAYVDAADLLNCGLDLLDTDSKWTTNFDLAFEMINMLARIELACGDFVACKAMVDEMVLRAQSLETKTNSFLIGVQCSLASNKMTEAAETAVNALNVCGFSIPNRLSKMHILFKLRRVRALFRKHDDQSILGLSVTQDRLMTTTFHLLSLISTACLLKGDDLLGIYAGLLATELTMKIGLAPHSPFAFTVFGLVEVSLGNIQRGYRLGKLALKLQDRLNCQDAESPTLSFSLALLLHWKEPIRDLKERMYHAMDSGYASGDGSYAIFSASVCNGFHFILGENLERCEQFLRFNYSRFSSLDNDGFILMLQPPLQYLINMRNMEDRDWFDLACLTGEIMDEEEFLRKVKSEENHTFYMIALVYKSILAYYFGYYGEGVLIYKKMASIGQSYLNSSSGPPFYAFGALTYYEQYRNTKKNSFLRKARGYLKSLQRMQSKGPNPNVTILTTLLLAIDASTQISKTFLTTRVTSLTLAFEQAIAECAKENVVHMEALANERAGFVFAELGLLSDAERYFDRAQELYLDGWGSSAKHEWLVEKSALALARLRGSTITTSMERLGNIIEVSHDDTGFDRNF